MAVAATQLRRVGLVMPLASQQGGAERLFQSLLATGGAAVEYEVLFLQNGPMVDEVRSRGYGVTVLPTTHLRDVRNYLQTALGIRRWIEQQGLELVFSWMLKAHLYAAPAALLAGRKRMWFQHGLSKRHWMDLVGNTLPADGILCCSGFVKEAQDARRPSHRTYTCHPGVSLRPRGMYNKAHARERAGLPEDAQVVCMVARLERWKGVHVFLEAACLLAHMLPDAVFCVAGGAHPLDRAYAREIERQAEISQLGERLRLLGQVPADEIATWHACADVVVHPVTEAEPFGMAVVEALAMGRAVVASKAGGITEILEDGVSGLFVPPGDAAALAGAVSRLLRHEEERRTMESAALLRAQSFSMDAFAFRFESLILSVLSA